MDGLIVKNDPQNYLTYDSMILKSSFYSCIIEVNSSDSESQ